VVNVVHQPPPSERPRGERRNPAATNFGATPPVYGVFAQVPPSSSPHAPVETYPVYKYVSERRASHVHRLKTVLNWTPEQATRPFEALDMLYRNILLSAKEAYEAVDTHSGRDFLLLLKIYLLDLNSSDLEYGGEHTGSDVVTALLNLETDALEILTLDLRSLVYLEEDKPGSRSHLAPYHKSLYDFMDEKSRAKDLFVPLAPICTHLAKCCMQRIIEFPEPELYTPSK
jgi:hypothetical protein